MKPTILSILPVGEFDLELVNDEFQAVLKAFDNLNCDISILDPASNVEEGKRLVRNLAGAPPDLLVIVPLRGLSAETIEAAGLASPAPCLILPIEGRYALPSSALAVGALRASTPAVELLYAPPRNRDFIERLGQIVRTARCYTQLRRSRIGVIGGVFPNLVSCRYDPAVISSKLGMALLPISFEAIRKSMHPSETRTAEIRQMEEQITSLYQIPAGDRKALLAGIRLHLALTHIAQEHSIDGFVTECWSAFPRELGSNPCLGLIEDSYTLACEGDIYLGIGQLIVRYLTGRPTFAGDLYDLDINGFLNLIHCGAPAALAEDEKDVAVGRSQLAQMRGFDTLTCRPRLVPGPVTLIRFYGPGCDELHLATGEVTGCEQSPNLNIRVKLNGDRWDFLEQCFGNHYVMAAGDIRKELKLLCKWLDVRVHET